MSDVIIAPHEQHIIDEALSIIESRWTVLEPRPMKSSLSVKTFAKLKLSHRKQEVFAVAFLNAQNELLKYCEMFFGTISACSVYPREVVRACIEHNAAAVIFMHNHPSGLKEPSSSDVYLTEQLTKALGLIDVSVLDHIIVGKGAPLSMAENGTLPN